MTQTQEPKRQPSLDDERRNLTVGGPAPGIRFKHTGKIKKVGYDRFDGHYYSTLTLDDEGLELWHWKEGEAA